LFWRPDGSRFAGRAHSYWRARLASLPPLLWPDRRQLSGQHERAAAVLPTNDAYVARVKVLGVSWPRLLMAFLLRAMARTFGQDCVLGALVDLRGPGCQDVIGLFATPIPLIVASPLDRPLGSLAKEIGTQLSAGYRHARFPINDANPRGILSPLYDAIFNFIPAVDQSWPDLVVSHGQTAPFVLTAVHGPHDIVLRLDHDTGALPGRAAEEFLADLVQDFERELRAASTPLAVSCSLVSPMTAAQESALLGWGVGPVVRLPEPATLPALFAAQVARTPCAIACEDAAEAVDYRRLTERVEDLAATLASLGARRGDVIAVMGRREISTLVALLAIQYVGAAFVPIDPIYPPERVAFILSDAAASLILTSAAMDVHVKIVRLDMPLPTPIVPVKLEGPAPDDIAYVMYTSGSTGTPKGVLVTQRGLANLAFWGAETLGEQACRGMLFTTSLVFDVAMFEIFSPLVSGGRVLVAEGFKTWMPEAIRNAARVVSAAPTVLDAALRAGALPRGVSCVVSAGEALPRTLADRLFAEFPQLRLINAYGPTEATVYASYADIGPSERGAPPIGRPLPNMALYVLDGEQALLP
jgi:non-ribosomal peptide synthetase component F